MQQVVAIVPLIGIPIISACPAETRIKVMMFVSLQKRIAVFASNLQLIKRKQLKSNKSYEKRKAKESISKKLEGTLLGTDDNKSSAAQSTSTAKFSSTIPSFAHLQLILAQLDLLQDCITALETSNRSASSCEVNTA